MSPAGPSGVGRPSVTAAGGLQAPFPAAFRARTCHVYVRPDTRSEGGAQAVPPTRARYRPRTPADTSFTRTSYPDAQPISVQVNVGRTWATPSAGPVGVGRATVK